VPSTITPAYPIDDTHTGNDTDETDLYLDVSDIEPDTIATTPPPAEVSALIPARPVSETVPRQSPAQREPIEPTVAPPAASTGGRVPASRASRLKELKAARLAREAERRLRKAQLGLAPSDDELHPTIRPTQERIRELKERSRARREQERLEKERQAKEREALEREATTSVKESAPLAPVTEGGLPGPSDNGQPSVHGTNNLTELEIALAAPDLSPEDRKFLEQRRFQYTTKMVPKEGLTTARQVAFLILWIVLTSSQEFLCHGLVRVASRRHRRPIQLLLVQARPGIA
jgi:hypothetical protein